MEIYEKKEIIKKLQKDGLCIRFLDFNKRDDFELVNIAVMQNGNALYYVSERLKNNKDIIMSAVKSRGNSIVYAAFQDKEIFREAILNDHTSYEFGKPEYKDEMEILLESMKISNSNMFQCSERLSNSIEVFKYALKLHNFSLDFCGREIINNKKCVTEAVKLDPNQFRYASYEIRSDKKFVEKLANSCGEIVFVYASDKIKSDIKIASRCLRVGISILHFPENIRNNRRLFSIWKSKYSFERKYMEMKYMEMSYTKYVLDDYKNNINCSKV